MSEKDEARKPEQDVAREVGAAGAHEADAGDGQAAPERQALRQWVSLGQAGSCDVRLGSGEIEQLGSLLRGSAGIPSQCLLVLDAAADGALEERLCRQLADAGFRTEVSRVGEGCRTLASLQQLAADALEARVTSDDLVCAVGGIDTLSLASQLCFSLHGRTPLALVPLDLDALVEGVVTPRGLDVAEPQDEALAGTACARTVIFDPEVADCAPACEQTLLARALMVSTAMCDGERSFSTLWDRAQALAEGDEDALVAQLMDTLKSRGHLAASASVATRQSIHYGRTFVRALRPLTGAPDSTLLAEALRFQARVSAGEGKLSVDDVLAQDELLETLGLPQVEAAVDPDELVAALKAERFRSSKRFLLGLPQALGRVRLSAVDDDLLADHARAWCQTRAPQA